MSSRAPRFVLPLLAALAAGSAAWAQGSGRHLPACLRFDDDAFVPHDLQSDGQGPYCHDPDHGLLVQIHGRGWFYADSTATEPIEPMRPFRITFSDSDCLDELGPCTPAIEDGEVFGFLKLYRQFGPDGFGDYPAPDLPEMGVGETIFVGMSLDTSEGGRLVWGPLGACDPFACPGLDDVGRLVAAGYDGIEQPWLEEGYPEAFVTEFPARPSPLTRLDDTTWLLDGSEAVACVGYQGSNGYMEMPFVAEITIDVERPVEAPVAPPPARRTLFDRRADRSR